MARRRFFVDSFSGGFAVISGGDAEHLARVLRVQPGRQFEVSDNRSVQLAEVVEASPRQIRVRLLEPVPVPGPSVRITLVAALIKFDRFEWLVEKATELGVAAVLPVEAERSETGLLAAARKRSERWRRIAHEASQQSRRVTLPEILPAQRLAEIDAGGFRLRLLLDENPAAPALARILSPAPDPSASIALLTGPEGGWTPAERERLAAHWTPVSLGDLILRAETAAIAALAVVNALCR